MSEWLVALLVAVISGAAGVIAAPRVIRDIRDSLLKEQQILAALPPTSPAHRALSASIEAQVEKLAARAGEPRRDGAGIALGLAIMVIFGPLTWRTVTYGGWWWLVAVPCGLITIFGIVGFGQDMQRRERDAGGRPGSRRSQ